MEQRPGKRQEAIRMEDIELHKITGVPIPRFRKDRKCKFPECSQTLSIYNPDKYCYVHQTFILIIEQQLQRQTRKRCLICTAHVTTQRVKLRKMVFHTYCLLDYMQRQKKKRS